MWVKEFAGQSRADQDNIYCGRYDSPQSLVVFTLNSAVVDGTQIKILIS